MEDLTTLDDGVYFLMSVGETTRQITNYFYVNEVISMC